jgi:hypothetical protein
VTHVRGGLTRLPCALTRLLGALTHGAAWLTNRRTCSDADLYRHGRRARSTKAAAHGPLTHPRSCLTHSRSCLTHPASCLTQSPARLTTVHKRRATPTSPQATRGRLRARQHCDFPQSPWTRTATRSRLTVSRSICRHATCKSSRTSVASWQGDREECAARHGVGGCLRDRKQPRTSHWRDSQGD